MQILHPGAELKSAGRAPAADAVGAMHPVCNELAAAAEAAGPTVAQVFLTIRAGGSGHRCERGNRQNDRQHDLVDHGHSPLAGLRWQNRTSSAAGRAYMIVTGGFVRQ